jgi:hypothetical protein
MWIDGYLHHLRDRVAEFHGHIAGHFFVISAVFPAPKP